MSVVLTVKVEGLIRPPLAQMASTKACYKLGLIDPRIIDPPLNRAKISGPEILCYKNSPLNRSNLRLIDPIFKFYASFTPNNI